MITGITDGVGAGIMGRKMFSGGSGPWEDDPNARGWWGDDPPFGHPVFVLTHHAREPLEMEGGTTFHFVTDGLEAALAQAREAAGDGTIQVHGGGDARPAVPRGGDLDELAGAASRPSCSATARRCCAASTAASSSACAWSSRPPGSSHVKYALIK